MENTITKFHTMHRAADALFNSLGALNPARDACFFAVNRGRMARQMLVLSDRLQTDDTETLLEALRRIYRAVENEMAVGLPSNCRDELIETLIARCEV